MDIVKFKYLTVRSNFSGLLDMKLVNVTDKGTWQHGTTLPSKDHPIIYQN